MAYKHQKQIFPISFFNVSAASYNITTVQVEGRGGDGILKVTEEESIMRGTENYEGIGEGAKYDGREDKKMGVQEKEGCLGVAGVLDPGKFFGGEVLLCYGISSFGPLYHRKI